MHHPLRQRIASIITVGILALIFWRILDRMFIVMWSNVPWWGFIVMAVLLFLAVDYLVSKAFR